MKYSLEFLNSNTHMQSVTKASDSIAGFASNWHISILVPARNEEALLPRCLSSIERARRRLPASVTSDVIVVDDDSTDRTCDIAERMLEANGTVIRSRNQVVGKARALAADIAISRYAGLPSLHWLAHTDADCCVPETWLLDQLAVAVSDVHAVAGIVSVDSFEEHGLGVAQRFRETYLIYPDGSHPHVHGANLGVRADAYLLAGGWSPLKTAEDHDLWNRLRAAGLSCVSRASVRVATSGRRIGRAPLGFAGALAAHNVENASIPA